MRNLRLPVPSRPSFVAGVLGALLALPRVTAAAEPTPSIDARTWKPSTDPAASLVVEPVATPGPGNWSLGAWAAYTHQPITLRRAGSDDVAFRPIESLLSLDLTGGVGIGKRAALGFSVPMFLYQDGSSNLPQTVHTSGTVPSTGMGDLAIHGKGTILANDGGGFGLAALGTVTLPTGDRSSFMGEGSLTAGARLLADYSLLIAGAQLSAGYHVRTDRRTWPDASVGGFKFGDVLPYSLGLWFRPSVLGVDKEDRQRWELALHGTLPIDPVGPFGAGDPGSAQLTPMLLSASDRLALGHFKDAFVLGGAEVGLTSAVGVPAFRVIAAIGWSPREHDMDHDGVPDDVDQCPEIPEDRDGFEDSDGCPEIDNDDDGVIDKEDACPNVAGAPSNDPKTNGCPGGDRDGDGVPDDVDKCPDQKGPKSDDPAKNGCPGDRDGDGIPDDADKCPDQPEDKDGFQDDDGCPDPDNDGDGIMDPNDACPTTPGEPSTDPKLNGCPNPDRDGDTYENDVDKCPDAAEAFNGVQDDDGCPDEGGKPLVTVDPKQGVKLDKPIKFTGPDNAPDVDPSSVVTLRAIALELHRHRDWTLAIGTKPGAGDVNTAQQNSLARAFAVVSTLSRLAKRDGLAETVGWDAVKAQPSSQAGLGFLVLVAPPQPAAPAPAPLAPAPKNP